MNFDKVGWPLFIAGVLIITIVLIFKRVIKNKTGVNEASCSQILEEAIHEPEPNLSEPTCSPISADLSINSIKVDSRDIERVEKDNAELNSNLYARVIFLIDTPIYQKSVSVGMGREKPLLIGRAAELAYLDKAKVHLIEADVDCAVDIHLPSGESGYCSNICLCLEINATKKLAEAKRLQMAGWDEDDLRWDIWPEFRSNQQMIDNCANVLAHGKAFDTNTDWPAYCHYFRSSDVVRERVRELHALKTREDVCSSGLFSEQASKSNNGENPEMSGLVTIEWESGGERSSETIDLSDALDESRKKWRINPPISESAVRLSSLSITKLDLQKNECSMSNIISHVAYLLASVGMSGYGAVEASKQLREVFDFQRAYLRDLVDMYKQGDLVPSAAKKLIEREYDRLEKNNHPLLKRILLSFKENLLEDGAARIDPFYVAERYLNPSYDSLFKPSWVERAPPKDQMWLERLVLIEREIVFDVPSEVIRRLDELPVTILIE